MAKRDKPLVRPLSPHLGIYRPQYTSMLSILHRITGVALSVGSLLLVYWLLAAASGPARYAESQEFFTSLWAQIAIAAWVFSFCYHFLNGIRHLVWDTGRGFDLKVARKSGYAVLIGALILTASLGYWFLIRAGGAT